MNLFQIILNYVKEFVLRLKTEKPKFFKTLQWIVTLLSAFVVAIMGLASQYSPEWLNSVPAFFNWTFSLPAWLLNGLAFGMWTWSQFLTGIIAVCAVIIGTAQLPNKD